MKTTISKKKIAAVALAASMVVTMSGVPVCAESAQSLSGYGVDIVSGATCSSNAMAKVVDQVNASDWDFDTVSKDLTATITKIDKDGNSSLQGTYNAEGKIVDEEQSQGGGTSGKGQGGSGQQGSSGEGTTTETVTLPEDTELTGAYELSDEAGKIVLSVNGLPEGYSYSITGWNMIRVSGSAITTREGTILQDLFTLDTENNTLTFNKGTDGNIDALFDGVKEITASIKVSITDGSEKAALSETIGFTLDLTTILSGMEINKAATPDASEVIISDDKKSVTVTNVAVTPDPEDVEFGEYIMNVTLTKDDNDVLTNVDFTSKWVNLELLRLNPSTGKTGENMSQYAPKYLKGLVAQLTTEEKVRNNQEITAKASKTSVTYNASKAQTVSIAVSGATGAVSYASSSKYVSVNSEGVVTIKKAAPVGTYTITVNAAKTGTVYAASKTVSIKVVKAAQTISKGVTTKTLKASSLKKAKKTFKIGAKATAGKVTYRTVKKNSYVKVASNGTVTVKKGTKKGTYRVKVKVTAAKTANYNAKSVTKTITVKVK